MATMKRAPAVLALLCSCVAADDELADVEQSLYTKPNCDDWGCGTNSPWVDQAGFHFLYRNGATNPQGFAIDKFEKNGTSYGFYVNNGRITGTHRVLPDLVGQGLIGARLHLTYFDAPSYEIMITGVGRVWSWAQSSTGTRFLVETYNLQWSKIAGTFQNLCSNPGADDELGMNEFHTLVFEGDVIDADHKYVQSTIDNTVVNFGCAGSALAKQHLTGHTEVALRLGFATTPTERTANLKMFVADYCGDGTPYTVAGQPLQWADHRGWVDVLDVQGIPVREALWTSSGAACFNTPRILANPSQMSLTEYSNITSRGSIPCASVRPQCPGTPYAPPAPYHLISANP
jgi:hypothetical protein